MDKLSLQVGQVLRVLLRVCFIGLQTQISFTGFNSGIQSFLWCVLSIALSVASTPIASYSVASSLYSVLLVVLTIVHFDGTSIHSIHTG